MKVKRHIIVHTDLTTEMWTDFESFLQQILFNKWNHAWYLRVLFECFCYFPWIQEEKESRSLFYHIISV